MVQGQESPRTKLTGQESPRTKLTGRLPLLNVSERPRSPHAGALAELSLSPTFRYGQGLGSTTSPRRAKSPMKGGCLISPRIALLSPKGASNLPPALSPTAAELSPRRLEALPQRPGSRGAVQASRDEFYLSKVTCPICSSLLTYRRSGLEDKVKCSLCGATLVCYHGEVTVLKPTSPIHSEHRFNKSFHDKANEFQTSTVRVTRHMNGNTNEKRLNYFQVSPPQVDKGTEELRETRTLRNSSPV